MLHFPSALMQPCWLPQEWSPKVQKQTLMTRVSRSMQPVRDGLPEEAISGIHKAGLNWRFLRKAVAFLTGKFL
jgi:hypothetical protein